MNDLEYLNQISAKVPAPAKPASKLSVEKIILRTILGLVAFTIVAVAALFAVTALQPAETTLESDVARIYHRSSAIMQTISSYNSYVKSSKLRSTAASLNTILTELNTNAELTITKSYGLTMASLPASEQDTLITDNSTQTLEKARLNGILDRYYASELETQLSYLLIIEESLVNKLTDSPIDQSIANYLSSSKASLEQLDKTLSSYSESE